MCSNCGWDNEPEDEEFFPELSGTGRFIEIYTAEESLQRDPVTPWCVADITWILGALALGTLVGLILGRM